MYNLLVNTILPASPRPDPSTEEPSKSAAPHPEERTDTQKLRLKQRATLLVATHLLNPLVFTISTRGSSESVLALFVLLTLAAAVRRRWTTAALLLGLSTHWKIYPFVYGVACVSVIAHEQGGARTRAGWGTYVRRLVSWPVVRFGLVSLGTFAALGVGMYAV
jgi:GPI mannosyltransferase 1 subunit M